MNSKTFDPRQHTLVPDERYITPEQLLERAKRITKDWINDRYGGWAMLPRTKVTLCRDAEDCMNSLIPSSAPWTVCLAWEAGRKRMLEFTPAVDELLPEIDVEG